MKGLKAEDVVGVMDLVYSVGIFYFCSTLKDLDFWGVLLAISPAIVFYALVRLFIMRSLRGEDGGPKHQVKRA
jgi:hypothetical protein